MRYADEIVDNPGGLSLHEQLSTLEVFEEETVAAIYGEDVANPVLRAYANTVRARGIGLESITAFMHSMKMDTYVFRYQTFKDLEAYTYGSAAVVGLMMCRVLGVKDQRADPHAEALGVAMQLSNFLRDIKEDWGARQDLPSPGRPGTLRLQRRRPVKRRRRRTVRGPDALPDRPGARHLPTRR